MQIHDVGVQARSLKGCRPYPTGIGHKSPGRGHAILETCEQSRDIPTKKGMILIRGMTGLILS